MTDNQSFRQQAHLLVDWMADYMENVSQYPVKSTVKPNEILNQLPIHAPAYSEPFESVWKDFQEIILPGITHWQSPAFHAYFPANTSYPSILAEMLMTTMGAQCMIWETSPAAAELEERVMNWLKVEMGLPKGWHGVIQDTASTATLAAILTAREKMTDYAINKSGFDGNEKLRVYCSTETHSSADKAVKIAGLGIDNLVKISVDNKMAMVPQALREAIENDISNGFRPLCVISAVGTTSTVAIDPVNEIAAICHEFGVWHHIDAAYAGTALLLPEYQHWVQGMELADSFVFNPHKWMFTNFDCTAYFVKDKEALIRTFEILPEYLKTKTRGQVNDYRDWGIPLGRRFRALKLWFVIRDFGMEGIRDRLRHHINLANWLAGEITAHPNFELVTDPIINMLVFRFIPTENTNLDHCNQLNELLIQQLNNSGKIFLTHTKVHGKYAIRMPIGQTYVEKHHIEKSWKLIQEMAGDLS